MAFLVRSISQLRDLGASTKPLKDMIESRYWRAELRSELIWLRRNRRYSRWSEKKQVLFERKLILVAFQIRSLLERPKVNQAARSATCPATRYKKIGNQPFTVIGSGWPHEKFDFSKPDATDLPALTVCNQLIHYYWMQTYRSNRSFESILVFSDYERHKWAYEIQIADLLKMFQVFADDSSALRTACFEWDEKKLDYAVKPAGT
ncbi:hypothetical protein [Pseudoxanthomonas winnipegensis]|uniref:hypothetical protein n=2 Tax=Pseudoxanthomonas winnipegensis TaxID=2480810 RepID=UPI00197DF8A2|nr:hypothetical protein [Pseudoxanthomonas winnipegensis]